MIQLRQILCPVDFSDVSRRAFDHAAALAVRHHATLTLLHVFHVIPLTPSVPDLTPAFTLTDDNRAAILRELERFADRAHNPGVAIECEVAHGSPAARILETATISFADLIVIGTHGRSGFERLALGSIAEKVLRKSEAPVLTVPPSAAGAGPAATFARILCPVDFSPVSMRALEYAIALAEQTTGELTVAHVFELEGSLPASWRERLAPDAVHRELTAREDERRERLAGAVPDKAKASDHVDTVMARGTPYREILRLGRERRCDLIVMGIHGHHAAGMMLFGSTTNQVVRHATCPVLTIRRA